MSVHPPSHYRTCSHCPQKPPSPCLGNFPDEELRTTEGRASVNTGDEIGRTPVMLATAEDQNYE